MDIIRVTKEFNFEMAHALYGYDGACKNIHGHSYKLKVGVIGKVKNNGTQNDGMIIDFSVLKEIVKTYIIDVYDHALMLNVSSPHKELKMGLPPFEKVILTKYQPTCENMLIDMVERIKVALPEGITLNHLFLRETETSFAEWYLEDNKP